ncbi:MOSC domain-containing protein [Azospirillum sp. TSO22-1]|uniref:MOSC domain-containing protein n=1 Tax=Azospirillum sp. TSO22-1 TaxID=716789 RepID=UPI000D610664|nr:MOSC domain-containing protein [Azospirillum sp. TSO22-1]PWC52898.1 hypothetical protein TSO221_12280 [Azospirillum sp. TSO22-1]
MTTVAAIRRYPIKGLSAEDLPAVELTAGRTLPFDRTYAILHGPAAEMDQEGWRPKSEFFTLVRNEKLAALDTEFDTETSALTIRRNGRPVARGRLDQPMGRTLIEQFFAAYMAGAAPGAPKIAEGKGFAFTDKEAPMVSLLNLASVHDLERLTKEPVDPGRFRANLWLDGLAPWVERDWAAGTAIRVGASVLEVVQPVGRCAAIDVAPAGTPEGGSRALNLLTAMRRGLGHTHCGVYARVVTGGRVAVGDAVELG